MRRHWQGLLVLGGLLVTASILLAQGGYGPGPGWISYPALSPAPTLGKAFPRFNTAPGRFDRNADGRVDLIIADRNGDGWGDYWATDRNYDGFIDDYQYDRNFDAKIDQWEFDSNMDGLPDRVMADLDSDGQPDVVGDFNPLMKSYAWYGMNTAGKQVALGLNGGRPRSRGRAGDSE